MLMAVEEDFDVARLETELADIVGNEVRVRVGPAVDQYVAGGIGDQDRGDAAGADEIGIAEDSDRRRGLFVIVPRFARGGEFRARDFDRRARLLDQLGPAERDDDLLRGEREEKASERNLPRSRRRCFRWPRLERRPRASG